MGVYGDAVGPLDPGEQASQPRGGQRRAAPGGINMEPEPLRLGDRGAGRQGVHHAGIGGAGSGGVIS